MNTQSVNISLYQKGDVSLEDIYKRYKSYFIRYVVRTMSDEFYAEDVVQDVFIGLFQQSNYFVSEAAALKYIYTAVYNRCIDLLRHKQTAERYKEVCNNKKRGEIGSVEQNELLTKEFFMIVERRIDALPPKCKQIFIMKYRKEFSNPEISERLRLSLRTVENQVYIARGLLRKSMDIYLCS